MYSLLWSASYQISVLVQLSGLLIHEHLKAFNEKVVRCYKDNPLCQAHHQFSLLTFHGQWSCIRRPDSWTSTYFWIVAFRANAAWATLIPHISLREDASTVEWRWNDWKAVGVNTFVSYVFFAMVRFISDIRTCSTVGSSYTWTPESIQWESCPML